jgi:hypothetical protein
VAYGRIPAESVLAGLQPLSNYSSSGSQDDPSLTEYCRYRADITVSVSPLSTGFSSQVHGLISITNSVTTAAVPTALVSKSSALTGSTSFQLLQPGGQTQLQQVLQYKAADTGVKCALAGRISSSRG